MHIILPVGLLFGFFLLVRPRDMAIEIPKALQTPDKALVKRMATKWGTIFGVPRSWIYTLAHIESSFKPGSVNMSPRAKKRGGAWGLMQMTLKTALSEIERLKKSQNETIKTTLKEWTGRPEDLLKPDLNVMLGTFYIAHYIKEFKTFKNIAAVYHQGPGTVRKSIRRKGDLALIGPLGKQYVIRALKVHPLYKGVV